MKINIKNETKLKAAIDKVESRARARCISVAKIQSSISSIEKTLGGMLHKKDWTGVIFHVDPNAQSFPSSYNGIPESTQVIVERFPSGWFITEIHRSTCRGTEIHPNFHRITLKADAFVDFAGNARNWN